MLLDRGRSAGKYFEWKIRLFSVGAVVALTGIYLDSRWVTGAAIVILMSGLLLRLLPVDPEDPDAEED
jgi:hypothetical protein